MNAPSAFHLYLYGRDRGPIESSFEDAAARLVALPGLYFEPDGSFAWAPDSPDQQVFGMLYDAASKIQYAELRGSCQRETWRQLCIAIAGRKSAELLVLKLPDRHWYDLQSFQAELWPDGSGRKKL